MAQHAFSQLSASGARVILDETQQAGDRVILGSRHLESHVIRNPGLVGGTSRPLHGRRMIVEARERRLPISSVENYISYKSQRSLAPEWFHAHAKSISFHESKRSVAF